MISTILSSDTSIISRPILPTRTSREIWAPLDSAFQLFAHAPAPFRFDICGALANYAANPAKMKFRRKAESMKYLYTMIRAADPDKSLITGTPKAPWASMPKNGHWQERVRTMNSMIGPH